MFKKENNLKPVQREVLKGFFVLEGVDGAGTTTQLKRLGARALQAGKSLRTDCEPTSHAIGSLIRSILRHQVEALPEVLAPLFAADRRQHLDGDGGIREALASGTSVVSDRYFFSSLAYQSLDRPWEEVWALNSSFPFPEVLFWFELPIAEAQKGLTSEVKSVRIEKIYLLKRKIYDGYHRALAESGKQGLEVVTLDARRGVEELTDSIWNRICR